MGIGTTRHGSRRRGVTARLCAVLATVTALFLALVPFSTPAGADPIEKCTATTGAIVAVDFGHWGGPVVRGCDAHPTTGMNLLHNAGFTTVGTVHDGPGFICRIGTGDFNGGAQYPTAAEESCVQTPKATAYWSYWLAPAGRNTWTYSPLGALSDVPKPGEVEAWVFGGTDVAGTSGQPAFSPDSVRAGGPGATPSVPPSASPSSGPGGSPSAPGSPQPSPAVAAAARWLVGRLVDGDHLYNEAFGAPDYARTALLGTALAAAGGQDATLTRITAYLAAHADDYLQPDGTSVPPDPTAVANLALLAEATGADPRDFGGHDLPVDLADHVCSAAGSLGNCTAAGDFHGAFSPSTQALGVLALARSSVAPPAAAVARLEQLQCADGGFSGSMIAPGEFCDPEPGTTALAAMALTLVPEAAPALAKATAYLADQQQADGSYLPYTGAPGGDTWSTALGTQALLALGRTAGAATAQRWIADRQNGDGGFASDATGGDSDLTASAQALIALAGANLATLHPADPDPSSSPSPSLSPSDTATLTGPPSPSATSSPSTPTPPAGRVPDLAKGVAYLVAPKRLLGGEYYEAFDGTGFADFGLTIDGAFALAATGGNDTALAGIVDFIDQQHKDGTDRTVNDWTLIGTSYAGGGSIAKEALLAQVTGRNPRNFGGHDLIAALDQAVCTRAAADTGCAAEGNYTHAMSVFSQSLGVIAQLRAGDASHAEAPIGYLRSLQAEDGSWPSLIPSTGDRDVDSTAMAVMALALVPGDAAAQAVDRGVAWIAARQQADGGFPGAAGDSTNSAALAIQGMSLHPEKYAGRIARARAFLAGQQNGDGGFRVASDGPQKESDLRASTQSVGGAVGTSFGVLLRDLTGVHSTIGPGGGSTDPGTGGTSGTGGIGGSGTGGSASGGSGPLAATGVEAQRLTLWALVLLLAGGGTVAVVRRRAATGGRRH
ncbi:prenyltransferase/squalene oxidase repeat-containing protein [Peterkaempfera bronchialis]|uniref:prenyltransferase/squalene oxidase repeat-containing protein n=1 Tax=Peterkaempfera bronchialis TaxID=2126346 RepID=UPI003C2E8889